MKRKFFTNFAIVLATIGLNVANANGEETQSQQPQQQNAEEILDLLNDTNSISQATPEENAAHGVRIRRLHDLQKQGSQIKEAAGAEATSQPSASSDNDEAAERLIEAIENLEIQIREHRMAIEHQTKEHSAEKTPETGQAGSPQTR